MRPGPPQRDDRLCARHGCKRELPAIAWREGDPFCSAECARSYHGVRFKADMGAFGKGGRIRAGRKAA